MTRRCSPALTALFASAVGLLRDPDAARPRADRAARRARRRRPRARAALGRWRRLVEWLAGPARAATRAAPAPTRQRESIERRLDLAGRPAALTVQRFVGLKAALAILLGLGVGGLLLLLGASPLLVLLLAAFGWFGPDVWLSRAGPAAPGARSSATCRTSSTSSPSRVRAGLGYRLALRRVAEALGGPGGRGDADRAAPDGARARAAARRSWRCASATAPSRCKSFVAAQLQAEELGVPLSEALNDIADDMRRAAHQSARRRARAPARA